MQKLKLLFKDGIKPFHIGFVGEEAVDHAAPFKKYFTLLFDEVKHQFLCTGGNLGLTFLHDIQKLQNGEFYLFGLLFCVGILKGCADPRCFLPSVVERIFLGTSTKQLSIKEISNLDIQLKLQTIADIKTEDEFQNIVDTFPERFGFGVTKFAISFTEKSEFIQQITQHFCFSMSSEEIQDFKRGLEQDGLYSILSEHFANASKEFSLSQGMTSTEIIKLFQTVLYSDVSADDTKKKNLEENIFYYFTNFLEVLETEESKVMTVFDVDENFETTRKVSLSDVAQFCNGSRHLTGDMKGTIQFDHLTDEGFWKRIEGSTCSQILTFPVTNRYSTSADLFTTKFCLQCTRFCESVKLYLSFSSIMSKIHSQFPQCL